MKNSLIVSVIIILIYSLSETNAQNYNSLINKSYDDLSDSFEQYKNDSINSEVYAKVYLQKAKQENNIIKQANGYYMLAELSNGIVYADSVIKITKDISDFNYPAKAHLLKARFYGRQGKFKKAMDELILSNTYAVQNENIDQQYKIKYYIGLLKENLGNYEESLKIFKSTVDYYQGQFTSNPNKYNLDYIGSLFALGSSFDLNKKYDSAFAVNKKATKLSLTSKDSILYGRLLLSSGKILYHNKQYKPSLDSILKFQKIAKQRTQSIGTLIRSDQFLGEIYFEQKNYTTSLKHLHKVDSLAFLKNYFFPDIRSVYETIIKLHKENKDIEKQLFYINRLLHVDSILDTNYKHISIKINDDYTTPSLILEKESIINTLEKNNEKTILLVIILIFSLVILSIVLKKNIDKRKIQEQRFIDLYEKEKKPINKEEFIDKAPDKTPPPESPDIGISDIIINDILKQLDEFERNQDYIQTNITVHSLSKRFKTNSKYLSKIINSYKGKSFSNYINELRIDYVVEKLKIDPVFRKYTMKALANEIGFNTTDAFTRSFQKKTGISPSFFMKQLDKKIA